MYDIIYIGGGLNYAGAIVAAKKGLKVALIERSLKQLGGVCLHKGCIPSKMFLHHAHTILKSKDDIFQGNITLDMQSLFDKKIKLIATATSAVTQQCKTVELIEGEGRIIAPHQVSVNGTIYEAKHIIIGTGSSAFIPEGIVYDHLSILTSDDVLNMKTLPSEIAIYGAGAIGLEMASFFAAVGVKTTLLSHRKNLLEHAHPHIQKALEKQLETLGITYLKEHSVSKAIRTDRGVHITFDGGDSLYSEKMLIATGRQPNTSVVGTDSISVNKGIDTNSLFETTASGHYAIGDCNGKLQLAHAAKAEVLNVTMRILGKKPKVLNLDHVVKFIHTLPMSYATVGQNKKMLEDADVTFRESIVPLNHFTASVFHHANKGMMIVYADSEGFILGAEIFAPDAEELIAPVSMALAGEMDAALARETIMAHPTFSEALERAYFKL